MNANLKSIVFKILFTAGLFCSEVTSALPNSGFEIPQLGNTFQYFPDQSIASWEFPSSDGSGISGPQSAFTYANDLTGHGQVAFIQGHGAFETRIIVSPGMYAVTFSAAQRGGVDQQGVQTIVVLVDGVERGRFTPLTSKMENYVTPEFVLESDRSYHLELRGIGHGSDFTAFIDDVTFVKVEPVIIKTDVGLPMSPSVKCGPQIAEFNVNFAPPQDLYQANTWVRHMNSSDARIVSSPSWYDASVNTFLDKNREGCARGPYATPTAPYNLEAQSTFQVVGKAGGFLILSRDAVDSMNPHAFYGIPYYPEIVLPWINEGDALAFKTEMRVPMVNIKHAAGVAEPVGQVYIAVNATDETTEITEENPHKRVVQFSIMMYDSRVAAKHNLCDYYAGNDGPHAVMQTTFSAHDNAHCPREKFMWVAPQTTTPFIAGGDLPNRGAWTDLRTFSARLTKDGLRRAIEEANQKLGGFNPDPAQYSLGAIGIILETIWFSPLDGIDAAVSFSDLEAKLHKAQ